MIDFEIIVKCRACYASSDFLELILEMDAMPLAGGFCESRKEALSATKFPLSWLLCHRCGLVQVAQEISEKSLFASYHYASSSVPGLVKHFRSYAEFLKDRHGKGDLHFLEIGCNDGVLLRELPSNWRRVGVDPSDVALSSKKREMNYMIIPSAFTFELAESQNWEGAWDVVSGSNCLAHISDLKSVFSATHFILKRGGWFWIEVHDLHALLKGFQWDTIYHEHKVEWSEKALQTCVESLGFDLRFVDHLPLHGGVIRCGFQKSSKPKHILETSKKANALRISLSKLNDAYRGRRGENAVVKLMSAKKRGETIAAYGASGRANVYLNQIPELDLDFVVDEAPLRVHRFVPTIGTAIVSRAEFIARQPQHCLLTAWNYRREILAKNRSYKGKWLSAFPVK